MNLLTALLTAAMGLGVAARDVASTRPAGEAPPPRAPLGPIDLGGPADGPAAGEAPPGDDSPRRWMEDRRKRGSFRGRRQRGPLGMRGPDRRGEPEHEAISPERERRILEFTQRHFPELYDRLTRLRETDPELYPRMLQRVSRPVSDMMRVASRHPELARKMVELHRIEMELPELRGQYLRAESDPERQRIKDRMRELLQRRFELRLDRLRFEIAMLERRLEETKQHLAEREHDKAKLIADELAAHLSPEGKGAWTYPEPPPLEPPLPPPPGHDPPDGADAPEPPRR